MLNSSNAVEKKLVTGYSEILPHLEIKDSPIQGKGLFSEVGLKPGTVLLEIVGEKIHHGYDPALSGENPNWIGTGYEEWLMLGPGDIAIYLNHSCQPNVIINEKLQLVTIQVIAPKGELLLDYSTTELDPYWEMECSCGASACRKILRSFQFLPPELRKKYDRFIAPSFKRTAEVIALHQSVSS